MVSACLSDVDVIILAGGLGSRLAPRIGGKPKVLAPVNGKPFLEFLFRWLSSQGAKKIILSLGYLADQVIEYIEKNEKYDMKIVYAVENRQLGTAGALSFVSEYIENYPAIVINGDSFVSADFCNLIEFHKTSSALVTILSALVGDVKRFGEIKVSGNADIVSFREKGNNSSSGYINAGIYVMSYEALDFVKTFDIGSLEIDVFSQLKLGDLKAYRGKFDFIDIGTPQSYERSSEVLRPYFDRLGIIS